jgi:hypothetical protein
MGALYRRILDSALGALLRVEFTTQGNEVLDFAVILLLETGEGMETVRVYDAAHAITRCTDTRAAGARSRGRSSTAVPLGKECALRSSRSSADTAR